MFTLESRINGDLIGVIRVLNTGLKVGGRLRYSVECHRFNRKPFIIKFDVFHKREEGAERLSFHIYKRLYEKIKEYQDSTEKEDVSK